MQINEHYKKSLNPFAEKSAIDLIFFGYCIRASKNEGIKLRDVYDDFRTDCGYSIDEFSNDVADRCYNRFVKLAKEGYLKGLSRSIM